MAHLPLKTRTRLFFRHLNDAWRVLRGKPPVHVRELFSLNELRVQLGVARSQVGGLATRLAGEQEQAPEASAKVASQVRFEMPESVLRVARTEPLKIVDVGAQLLTSQDHVYAELVRKVPTEVIGFEPLEGERQRRLDREPGVRILPWAIGAGGPATLRETRFNPASSLLEPNAAALAQFTALPEMLEVASRTEVQTRRIDDVPEAAGCRLLKIDVQGAELAVLQGGTRMLEDVLFIFTEVEFFPVYENQPLFAEVHEFLVSHGFELLDLVALGYGSYRAALRNNLQSKLLWADGVFVRSLSGRPQLSEPALVHLACAAHYLVGKYDYAMHVLTECDKRHGSRHAAPYLAALLAACDGAPASP